MKIKHIETGEVFEVVRFSGEYWIDDTGYIESDQIGVFWELVDDYKQLYEQQKQRADELEKIWCELSGLVNERTEKYSGENMTAYFTLNAIKKRIEELQEGENGKYSVYETR